MSDPYNRNVQFMKGQRANDNISPYGDPFEFIYRQDGRAVLKDTGAENQAVINTDRMGKAIR